MPMSSRNTFNRYYQKYMLLRILCPFYDPSTYNEDDDALPKILTTSWFYYVYTLPLCLACETYENIAHTITRAVSRDMHDGDISRTHFNTIDYAYTLLHMIQALCSNLLEIFILSIKSMPRHLYESITLCTLFLVASISKLSRTQETTHIIKIIMNKVEENFLPSIVFTLLSVYWGIFFLLSLLFFISKNYLLIPYNQIHLYPSVRTLLGLASSTLLSSLIAHAAVQCCIFFLRQAAQAYNLLYAPQYLSLANYILSYNQCIILLVQYCPLMLLGALVMPLVINIMSGTIFDKKIIACAYDTYMVLSTALHSILYIISWLYNHALFQLLSFLLTHNMYTAYCILSDIFATDLPRNTHYFHNNHNPIPSDIFRNFGSMLHIKILLKKYSDDTEALEETCKDIEESLSATPNAYKFLEVMMYLATIGALKAGNIHALTRALLKHYKNKDLTANRILAITYMLHSIRPETIDDQLIHHIISGDKEEVFKKFIQHIGGIYVMTSRQTSVERCIILDIYILLRQHELDNTRFYKKYSFIDRDITHHLQHASKDILDILTTLRLHASCFNDTTIKKVLLLYTTTTPEQCNNILFTLRALSRSGLLHNDTLLATLDGTVIPNDTSLRSILPHILTDNLWEALKSATRFAKHMLNDAKEKEEYICKKLRDAIIRQDTPAPITSRNYGNQSTHTTPIHAGASRSASILSMRYPNCDVTQTISLVRDYIHKKNNKGFIDRIKNYFTPNIQSRLIHHIDITEDYTDPTSQISCKKLLALSWIALEDTQYHPSPYNKDDAKEQFLKTLEDILRAYNLTDNMVDIGGFDSATCPGGMFNKICEGLYGLVVDLHQEIDPTKPLIDNSINESTIREWTRKLECEFIPIVKEEWTSSIQHKKELHGVELTEDLYITHLRESVRTRLKGTYPHLFNTHILAPQNITDLWQRLETIHMLELVIPPKAEDNTTQNPPAILNPLAI